MSRNKKAPVKPAAAAKGKRGKGKLATNDKAALTAAIPCSLWPNREDVLWIEGPNVHVRTQLVQQMLDEVCMLCVSPRPPGMHKMTAPKSADLLQSISRTLDSLQGQIAIPCALHRKHPPPAHPAYEPARALAKNGLAFSGIQLLHAIGVKYSGMAGTPEEIAVKRLYLADHIDFTGVQPRLARKPRGDFPSSLSHEIGVGFCCLAASAGWGVPWDQLMPIPGRGKRFDFRGKSGEYRGIWEAKGSTVYETQLSQVRQSRDQKAEHRARGDRADIELIVATRVGEGTENSCIMFADPPFDFDHRAFDPNYEHILRLRHFAKALLFAGAQNSAVQLHRMANQLDREQGEVLMTPQGVLSHSRYISGSKLSAQLETRRLGQDWYMGFTVDPAKTQLEFQVRQMAGVSVFQGMRADVLDEIETNWKSALDLELPPLKLGAAAREGDTVYSAFPDGTILACGPA